MHNMAFKDNIEEEHRIDELMLAFHEISRI